MSISKEQLSVLQNKIVKKITKETGIAPSEFGDIIRFDDITDFNRGQIMMVAKMVCKKFAQNHSLSYDNDSDTYLQVGDITVVGVYMGGKRVSVFNY